MRAGKLRHRLTFEYYTETPSPAGNGQLIKTWNECGTFWGEVRPLNARELITAQQVGSRVSHMITIRNRPPSTTTPPARLRIWSDGRLYNLEGALSPDQRGIQSQVPAIEEPGATR